MVKSNLSQAVLSGSLGAFAFEFVLNCSFIADDQTFTRVAHLMHRITAGFSGSAIFLIASPLPCSAVHTALMM